MRFLTQKRRQPPAVIIISLIDILIVLLIFLMVTTTFKQQPQPQPQPAVKLALPESVQGKAGADPAAFIVTIAKQEPYFYLERDHGSGPVTFDKLRVELKRRAGENPQVVLSVKADKEAPFGQIIRLMDLAREAKIKSINAFIKPPGVR